ncbi:hypothetical protein D515_02712 [Grimontia indica]|uniref:Uncharacterized protein n=1 Tax=Grimontia indica TaxID=1056512 RepID=R1IT80_9GAMM|nr:hypothetical protein D515_02712 [Grimontia indica]
MDDLHVIIRKMMRRLETEKGPIRPFSFITYFFIADWLIHCF